MKQHDVSTQAVITKYGMQDENRKTRLDRKDGQRFTIKLSNTVRVAKQKLLDRVSKTRIIVMTKSKAI